MVEHKESAGEKKESAGEKPGREGPYTKLIAVGTVLLVVIGYITLAYTVHLWPDSSPNPAPTSSPSTEQTGTGSQPVIGVPADYQGTWQGNIVYGTTSDRVSMTIGHGTVGTQVGEFTNYALGCQRLVYLEGGTGPIYLRLVATSNSASQCASFVYARVTKTSTGLDIVMEDTSEVVPTDPVSNAETGAGSMAASS